MPRLSFHFEFQLRGTALVFLEIAVFNGYFLGTHIKYSLKNTHIQEGSSVVSSIKKYLAFPCTACGKFVPQREAECRVVHS